MSNDRLMVKILTNGTVPIYGRGPMLRHISMPRSDYELLKKHGIAMDVKEEPTTPFIQSSPKKEERKEVVAAKKEAVEKEEVKTKKKADKEKERVLVDDSELSAEAYYTFDFLTKKTSLKILTARDIEPESNNSTSLKEQVLNSNPVLPEWQKEELGIE